jgi:hypothetical protein
MKKIDLSNDQTRLDLIEAIVKASSHYTCGNVDYTRTDARIGIFDSKHETFHSTGILTELGAFSSCASYNRVLEKVMIKVW